MGNRIELHNELLQFSPNLYFQPPSNIRMVYPCIVYTKSGIDVAKANNKIYKKNQEYSLTIMESNPESIMAESILDKFQYATLGQSFVVDNLYHTTIKLYY